MSILEKAKKIIDNSLYDLDIIKNASATVLDFLKNRGIVIIGGVAIDYALKLKGSYLYDDDFAPDFDVISSHNVDDAYDIGYLLNSKGFPEVAVNRNNIPVMRVKVGQFWIADLRYIPESIIVKIKTIDYQGIKIVSPEFNYLEMHKALSFPFWGAPHHNVHNKWYKFINRFNLLQSYYPIKISQPDISTKTIKSKLPMAMDKFAFCGFAAYAIIRNMFDNLLEQLKIENNYDDIPKLNFSYTNGSVSLESPDTEMYIILASSYIPPGYDHKYKPTLDIIPPSYEYGTIMAYHFDHLRLSICRVEDNLRVVSCQYLMTWLLTYNMLYGHSIYLYYYEQVLKMCQIIDLELSKMEGTESLFLNSPFGLPLNTIGDDDDDIRMKIPRITIEKKLGNVAEEDLKYVMNEPDNYYPRRQKKPVANYNSFIYQYDGSIIE